MFYSNSSESKESYEVRVLSSLAGLAMILAFWVLMREQGPDVMWDGIKDGC